MKKLFALCALVLLASCQSAPEAYKPQAINLGGNGIFDNGPIRMNVAEIRLIENYQAPMVPPSVDHIFPTPPASAIKQWVKQRMQAVGTQNVLEISIDDASAKEVLLDPNTDGVRGIFTYNQEARYDANIRITLRLFDGVNALPLATGDVLVSRSRTISEKASVNDHLRLYDGMTQDMMYSVDSLMIERLNQYFAAHIAKKP